MTISPRKRRRWWIGLVGLIVFLLAAVAALPWALSTPAGRRWIVSRADRILAPGAWRVSALRLSWFGPTRMTGFVLIDHAGDRVVSAPRATLDRNLWQILFDRPRYGTLTLQTAALDIERLPSGDTNLMQTIRPLIRRDPRLDLTIQVVHGSLQFRSAGLKQPLSAERAEVSIQIPPAPAPLAWNVQLANTAQGGETDRWQTLGLRGSYDRWSEGKTPHPDFQLTVSGRDWPVDLALAEVEAAAQFSGDVEAVRKHGEWNVSGSTWLDRLDASGSVLSGDHLRLDRLGGPWAFGQTAGAWSLRLLNVASPIGSLKLEGVLPAPEGASARIVGHLDLAALAQQLPHALRLREGLTLTKGSTHLEIVAQTQGRAHNWQVQAQVADLAARDGEKTITLKEPATLSASVVQTESDVRVDRLGLKTAFLDLSAQGDLDRGVSLTGSIDLVGVRKNLGDLIDFGMLDLAGQGRLQGDYRREGPEYRGHVTLDMASLRVRGPLPQPIEAKQARIDIAVSGAADATGLPRSWQSSHWTVQSGGLRGELLAARKAEQINLTSSASIPLTLADHSGTAKVRLQGRWAKESLAIEQLRAVLQSGDRELFGCSAKGQYDRASGSLVLEPAGDSNEAIAVARDGVRISGLGRADSALQAEASFTGQVEPLLQAWSTWTGQPQAAIAGAWQLRASARKGAQGYDFSTRLNVQDLSWPKPGGQGRQSEGPISLALRGVYREQARRLDLAELVLGSNYATLEASGKLDDLSGERLIDLKGTLTPDWKKINALLAEQVEPQAHIQGRTRPFRVRGSLAGGSTAEILQALHVEGGIDLVEAEFFGMRLGPTPIVVRNAGGRWKLDPIRTTLNGGQLAADPEFVVADDGSLLLQFAPGATLANAEVNTEVSHRVLSYIAPIMAEATRVRGAVSARIDRAEFPLVAASGRRTVVEGQVEFRNVEFAPGPIADQLFDLIGQDRVPVMRLNQPVNLAIADGKVLQRGLAIPIGRLTQIEIEGSVDFDRNMDLTASLPITPQMLGNNPVLMGLVGNTRISVPIRGTLAKPKLDKEAVGEKLLGMTKGLLERAGAGVQGIGELINRFRRRDPDAEPPPTRQERRMRRQERKAERRLERPQ